MTWPIDLGDLLIHRIVEEEHGYSTASAFMPGLRREELEAHMSWFAADGFDRDNDTFVLSYHSYVVQTPNKCVVIDTCVGNDKTVPNRAAWNKRQNSEWLANFAATGLSLDDVDFVLCTHLHHDHIGWNTRLIDDVWVPTFPNARYMFVADEYEYWREWPDKNVDDDSPIGRLRRASFAESVQPIIDSGRAELVRSGHELGEYFRFISTPGHTPGHSVIAVGRQQDRAVFTGDLIHSPIQAVYPEIPMPYDWDKALGAAARRSFLERYSGTSTLVCTMHFPAPSAGYVRPWKNGFRLRYLQS